MRKSRGFSRRRVQLTCEARQVNWRQEVNSNQDDDHHVGKRENLFQRIENANQAGKTNSSNVALIMIVSDSQHNGNRRKWAQQ